MFTSSALTWKKAFTDEAEAGFNTAGRSEKGAMKVG